MKKLSAQDWRALTLVAVGLALSGCGGGPGGSDSTMGGNSAPQSDTLGGTIAGLGNNAGLVLANGSDSLQVAPGSSTFTMPTKVSVGSAYSVTVQASPAGVDCTVSQGSGSAGAGNVTNISVSCSNKTYTVGGTLSGLTASGLVLANGADTFSVPSDATSFTMPTEVAYTSSYQLLVQTQPRGETCTVSGGSGTMGTQAVTNISVACSVNPYTVGGSISGLANTQGLVLANGVDTLTVAAGATAFTMPIPLADGAAYNIVVQSHPPLLQCAVSGGAGTITGASVTGVSIACAAANPQFSVLYSFNGPETAGSDGAIPTAPPTLLSDGNYYGLTTLGGASGNGTVYKLTPSGTETLIHSFAGQPADGARPSSGFLPANDGSFYATTSSGGPADAGTLIRMTSSGVVSVVYSFTGTADGGGPTGSLVQTSDGSLYGVTTTGGAHGQGTVYRITLSGNLTTLYSFAGPPTDAALPEGLVLGNDGNLYGVSLQGGANGAGGGGLGAGTVFKITPDGTETLLYSFGATVVDGQTPLSMLLARDGNFYGVAEFGGANGGGMVFQMTSAGAVTSVTSFGGLTGTLPALPNGTLFQASDGYFYGLSIYGGEAGHGTLYTVTNSSPFLSTLFSDSDGTETGGGGALAQSPNGDLRGVTFRGGAHYEGSVFTVH